MDEAWKLCVADNCSTRPEIHSLLGGYAVRDRRIKVAFCETREGLAEASNSVLAFATGDFVAMLDHDDVLAPHVLYIVVEEINAHPDANLIYSDEDKDRCGSSL